MAFNNLTPYNSLPDLPPKVEVDSKDVLKKAISANKALAELKGKGNLIPNQAILISSLILQESKDSSEIENIVTTNDALYKAAGIAISESKIDSNTKEVLRYREALWSGFSSLHKQPFSTNMFIAVMQEIRGIQEGIRKLSGTRIADGQGNAVYTPPEGEIVIREKLSNLEKYIHGYDDTDPLIKAALFHYQFEAIHPFSDGNGRTGRVLTILYLVSQNLLEFPVIYLSKYILEHRKEYYTRLRNVTEQGAWIPWILYMLDAIENTAVDTRLKLEKIHSAMIDSMETAKASAGNAYSKDLVELIFRFPYCKIKFVEQAGIAKRVTASKYLKEFERIGILQSHAEGNEVYYINKPLMEALA